LNTLFQPFHGDGEGRVQVTVPKGASVSEVGDLLSEKGVIDDSTLFQIRVTLAGKRSEIYSGNFTLANNMSYSAAIDALSEPPVKRTLTVTIPEGYTRSQVAQLVEEVGVPGHYTKATVKSRFLDPAEYGGKGAKDLEGFLFPNTFELRPNAPVEDLVQLQLQDFKRQIKKVDMSYAKSKNLTVYDVVTIASMIEEEAGVDSQRKLVAAVIYNRLKEGMPLGIDATIRFATNNYTEPLTESELAIDSPYNSRTNTGLPPGPIANPGLDSLEAAAHPAKTDHLFYVTTPGACGKLTFTETEDEFEEAVAEYNSAREAAGGKSPDSCEE
ncbi:MAG TPA: endolytic transglycosylase MltG, partial [Solirubrobacterales bacterium]|nr:endolytic transglycosylase MltG [Solirubrobacterales bacterium]